MKKYLRNIFSLICFSFLFFATAQNTYATHSMGADLTYRCLGGNVYEITLSFYRDCVGVAADDSAYISLNSSCQGAYYCYLLRVPGTGQEITPICPSMLSTCRGGTFTGIQEYVFKRDVILPGQCTDWTFSYNLCCRNWAITNITTPGNWQLYIYATLNNTITPCNNSPTFSNKPVPFICQGQTFCFNHGAYDVDGDSLAYSLITPWDSPGLPIVYNAPFTANNPLTSSPAVTFNPTTGDICMTPTNIEITVMAVLVKEYRNGVLIGSVERDIQVTVIACTNQLPALTGINGTNVFSETVCAGSQTCFNIFSNDADVPQNTFVTWDGSIPAASFNVTPGNRQSATFCWTPTSADISSTPYCFTATVRDDNCPYYGSQTFSYCITVEGIQASVPNQIVGCNSTVALIATASGGSGAFTYQWSTGATTQSITEGPGTYNVAVSDGTCSAIATSVVTQTPPVNSSVVSSNVICNGGNTGSATVTAGGGSPPFSYSWSPSGGTAATASNLTAGIYTVTVTDAMGCTSTSSSTITEPTVLAASATATPVLCNGGNDGSATATASNGTPGYTYSWAPSGGTGATANGLTAGAYTVTVTDANGCITTTNTTVTEPTLLAASVTATPVLCNGGNTGSATVTANNGTPGYTYSWVPSGGTGATATGLTAGAYTVTITDANGCITTTNATVTEPTLLVASSTATPVLCNGGADGSGTVAANGGTPGYTYSWSPSGGTGITANGLVAGSYTVTVTDANGCITTNNATVTEPTLLVASASATPVLCNGGADGTATVTANNGTPGYIYLWSSGGTGLTESGLIAGAYTVTVTDANGCITTTNTTVTEPTLLTASATATNVLCNGGANGTATVTASNGTPGYTYLWSSGGTGATESGLIAGVYTVTVTDANGCITTTNTTVTEPTLLAASATATNVLCNGGADGTATVTASNGTSGYTYLWSSGGMGITESGLVAGAYTVTVTDANGCITTTNTTITEPTLLVASATATPVLCNGGNDGSATVTANNGTSGYTYLWSTGGTGTTESGLIAGAYTVTVTDANGCITTTNTIVTEPTLLTASATAIPVLCNGGNDGSATVTANNGTSGYTYSWSPSGGTDTTANGLVAGAYTVIITDANGCITTTNTIVTEPTLLLASATTTPVLCNGGNDGSATVTANDGTPGYTYSWSSGGTGVTESGLVAGAYTVTVTDANGCTTTTNTTVTEPTLLVASTTSTPVLCNGGNDGSATVTANNGTPGYSYSWSSGGTGVNENGLVAGSYTVTVTDANGCSTITNTTVTEPTLLTATAINTPVFCNGGNTGTATVTAVDGTAGYTYSWTPSGGAGPTANGLTTGIYIVVVTDANGCTAVANTFVNEPTLLTATITSTPVVCNGASNGAATVTATDGTPGYTYSWSSGGTGLTESGLAAGTYPVTVTDANGCTAIANAVVTEPALISVSPSATPCLCHGSSDGSASVNVTGGVGAFTFAWAPGGASTSTVNNIVAGNYNVTITDSNGCVATSTAIVSQPAALNLALSSTPALCNGDSSGAASVVVSGGTSGYSYSWFPSGSSAATSTNLSAGNYSVSIVDAHGCTIDDSILVAQPSAINLSTNSTPAICGSANGSASVSANGGSAPYSYAWSPVGGAASTANNISAGAYTVTVTDANGCTSSTIANVLTTGGPTVNANPTAPVSCNGGSDGSASVVVSNGTAPFTYLWSPSGGTNSSATGLAAGNYAVTVTDGNACISSDNVTITEPPPVSVLASSTNTLCHGSADGSATVNAVGGTGAYTYLWAPGGAVSSTATNLAAGSYHVTVTDANGCTATTAATVLQPTSVTLVMSSIPPLCNGASSGSASVTASGGASGYSYLWTPDSATTQSSGGLSAGTYSVLVTDAHGCTANNTVVVSQPPPLNISTNSTPATCNASNGSAAVVVNGGASPYNYQWSPIGGTSSLAANLSAGTYMVNVTDAHGCIGNHPANVSNAGGPIATAAVTSNVNCFGGNNGSATVTVASGHPPFTYIWSPSGGAGTQATNLTAGSYSIFVSDVNGCITLANVTITEPPQIIATISATPATCGAANGSASAVASGGTGALSYLWSPSGGTAANATGLPGGNYSVLITDAHSCTQNATTTVINSGGATAALQSSANVTCFGGANGSASVTVSGGAGPFTFLWSPSGGTTAAATNLSAGNYSVVITDTVGCVSNVNVTITQPPAITMIASNTPAGCNGVMDGSAMVQTSGGVAPYTYAWTPVAGNDSVLNNIASGIYSVLITDNSGCIDSIAVTVTSPSSVTLAISSSDISCFGNTNGSASVTTTGGTSPFTYLWSPSGGTSPQAVNLTAGTYAATVTDSSGCVSVISAIITQPPVLAFNVSGDATLCVGQNTTIAASATGGTMPYSYLWDNGVTTDSQFVTPSATTIYTVNVTDANGCTLAPQSVTVTLNPPLNLTATATPEICAGDSASIAAFSGGGNGGPYTYSWNNDAIATSFSIVYPNADTTFIVTVNDGCSPPVQEAVSIIVNPIPQANFLPQLLNGCTPVLADFTNHGTAPAGSFYQWNLGDGTVSTDANVSHTYATPGHYTVSLVVTSPAGCTNAITVVDAVNVAGLPTANFDMSSHEVTILSPSIDFTDGSTDVVSWNWNFGDNSTSSDINPTHNYADTGSYTIQLIVQNASGCMDTTYSVLRIEDDFTVFVPNAFTPNMDNINDGFIAVGIGWKDYEMFIIDRWGLEIFHSTSRDHPWNGTYYDNGNKCQSDVYEYIIRVHDKSDILHKFIGHVTLVN